MRKVYKSILVILMILFIARHISAQSGNEQIQIVALDYAAFPNISLSFRAFDRNSITTLVSQDMISLQDNSVPVSNFELHGGPAIPQILVFVFDTGFAELAMDDEVTDLLVGAANFLQDGDKVIVLEHTDSQPGRLLFGPDNNIQHFIEWITTYQRQRTTSNRDTLQSLELALTQIESLPEYGSSASTIIYVGQLIEAPRQGNFTTSLTQLHQRASRLKTSIFSFNLATTTNINAQRVNDIASSQTGSFRLVDGQDPSILLEDFYAGLLRQRLTYVIRYRVPTINVDTDNHSVSIQVSGASANANYYVPVELPVVTITVPVSGYTITREAYVVPDNDTETTNDRWAFRVSNIPIQASVSFPDGITRDIVSAQLLVDGVATSELSGTTTLNYVWDISRFTERGTYSSVIQVLIVDSFGLANRSVSQTIGVLVDIPEDVVAPQIERTVVVQTECDKDIGSINCILERGVAIVPWVLTSVLLVFIATQRRKIWYGAVAAKTRVVRIASFVRDSRIRPKSEPYAEFYVIEGSQHVGSTFPMYGQQVTFGRDPEGTDIQLYPLEQAANEKREQCSISSKHCTVEYDVSTNRFLITDHSRFGTFVKRSDLIVPMQLKKDVSEPLHDGDEIILGVLSANGSRLRFSVSPSVKNSKEWNRRISTNVNEQQALREHRPTDVNDGHETAESISSTSGNSNSEYSESLETQSTSASGRNKRASKLTKL